MKRLKEEEEEEEAEVGCKTTSLVKNADVSTASDVGSIGGQNNKACGASWAALISYGHRWEVNVCCVSCPKIIYCIAHI